MANPNRHQPTGQFTTPGANADMQPARHARRHIQRIQNMQPSADNIMRAHEAMFPNEVTIPSGPFWQQT